MAGKIPSPITGHGGLDSRCRSGISPAERHAAERQDQEGGATRDASSVSSGQIRGPADGGSSDGGASRCQGGHWQSGAGAELADGRVGLHEINININEQRCFIFHNTSDLTLFSCLDIMSTVVDGAGEIFNNNSRTLAPAAVGSQVALMSIVSVRNTLFTYCPTLMAVLS